jgi:hypothetical protein
MHELDTLIVPVVVEPNQVPFVTVVVELVPPYEPKVV